MAVHTGKLGLGLYTNGCGELGNDTNFTTYNWYTADSLSGDGCMAMDFNARGNSIQGQEYVPVDTSKYYYHSVSVKTYERSYNARLGSGHLGFACYDSSKQFIDLRNCGDVGNTFLSRPAAPGDTELYLQSSSGWLVGEDVTATAAHFRQVLFYPADHPEYNIPHEYTRLNYVRFVSLVSDPSGDWKMTLDAPLPNFGYALPTGTPISRGVAGGTYNYCHGAPLYPETWTTYTTGAFTGENRNSSLPFRYATKYIKFLNLANYNYRNESGGSSAKFLLDNIMAVQAKSPPQGSAELYRSINQNFFNRENVKWLNTPERIKQLYLELRSI